MRLDEMGTPFHTYIETFFSLSTSKQAHMCNLSCLYGLEIDKRRSTTNADRCKCNGGMQRSRSSLCRVGRLPVTKSSSPTSPHNTARGRQA